MNNKHLYALIIFFSFFSVMCYAIGYAQGMASFKEELPSYCAKMYGFLV